ncbi:MAG TPA: hypothetical protein VJ552_02275 [Sediminibacterium sp.]|nr:hypothetical protein [Sediminibacterium sp.]
MNHPEKRGISASAILFFMLGITFISCNVPGDAAKIISKKAREQARKYSLHKAPEMGTSVPDLDCLLYTPSISEIMFERTELISTW